MSNMTKERAAQIAAGGGFNFDEIEVLARIALASLEAGPVVFIGQRMLEELTDGSRSCGRVWSEVTDKLSDENRISLYTAPPAPVSVPDALADDIDSDDHPLLWSYNNGWNACRAAMLQGVKS